jgi:hypothetical protein
MFRRPPLVTALRLTTVAILLSAFAPAVAGAQGRGAPENEDRVPTTDSAVSIPRSMVPPAGKCRIWMKGVPAAQQPAPTDCATALRQSPSNGVLVFGPATRDLSPFERRRAAEAAERAERNRREAAARAAREARADSSGGKRPTTERKPPAERRPTPTRDPVEERMPARRPSAAGERPAPAPRPPTTRAPASTETPPARRPPATKKPE